MKALNLFGGPGGTCLGFRALGIEALGIEIDDAACATRAAAGLPTVQGDVSLLDPLHYAPVDVCAASPPCPTFSSAGKGDGIADLSLVYQLANSISLDRSIDVHAAMPDGLWRDTRSRLVIEPLRWALLLEPRFLMWEQVPTVLGFWEHCAEILRLWGWSVWCGKVEAERFGVPQTRERAILMADREGPIHPPRPTHQRYVKGEPQRHEVTLEGEVLPWVSMVEALGWGPRDELERQRGKGMVERYGERPTRTAEEPAFTVRAGTGGIGTGMNRLRGEDPGGLAKCRDRWFRHRANKTEWVMEKTEDRPERKAQGAGNRPRSSAEPAATITSRSDLSKWVGPRDWGGDGPQPDEGEQSAHAIRVTLEEALILQSFPPDYPVQGTKRQRFLQIGNAVPPLLAKAILSALLPADLQHLEQERSVALDAQPATPKGSTR